MKKLALLLAAVLTLETLVPSLTPVSNAAELVPEVIWEQENAQQQNELQEDAQQEVPVEVLGTNAGDDENSEFDFKLYNKDQVQKIPNKQGEYVFLYNRYTMEGDQWLLYPGYKGEGEFTYTAASSDSEVASVSVSGNDAIAIVLKKAGKTNITVDVMKADEKVCTQTLAFEFVEVLFNYTPDVPEIDLSKQNSATVSISWNEDDHWHLDTLRESKFSKLEGTGITLTPDLENHSITLTANDDVAVGEYKYEVYLELSADNSTDKIAVNHGGMKVKIINGSEEPKPQTPPKTVAKQVYKLNTFYTNGYAQYKMTVAGTEITDAEVVDSDYFEASYYSYNKILEISMKDTAFSQLTATQKKKASRIKVKFYGEDGREWTKDITVGYTKSVPRITLDKTGSTAYLFTDGEGNLQKAGTKLTVHLMDKKNPYYYDVTKATLTTYTDRKRNRVFSAVNSKDGTEEELNTLTVDENGNITFYFLGDVPADAKIAIQCSIWTEPIVYNYKVTVSKKAMTAKWGTSKVLLNARYGDQSAVSVNAVKVGYESFSLGTPELVSKPKKATYGTTEEDTFRFEAVGNQMVVTTPKNENLPAGTYRFKIPVTFYFEDGVSYTTKPLTFTVTLKNQEIKTKDLSIKKKGSLSISKGGNIMLTPTLKNVNAKLCGIDFSSEDIEKGIDSKIRVSCSSYYNTIYVRLNYSEQLKKESFKTHLILYYQIEGTEEVIEVPAAPLNISIGR